VTSQSVRFLAVSLAAVLLAASVDCRGEESAIRPDGSGTPRPQDNAAAQDNGTAIRNEPRLEVTDPTRSPDNLAETGGDAGADADLREPSFGKESPPVAVADPIEPVNRGIFYVNDKLYRWILKPVAKGYRYGVPEGVRVAVRNFFSNLGTPIRAANTLLQGKFKATGTELARFAINSTIGMAGLFDAAKEWNLHRKDEDTGQTLGVYGLGQGMYIVLPVLGPSSARDAAGLVGDAFLDPLSYLPTAEESIGARAFRSETDLSFRFEDYDELTAAAVDPYIAVRDAYIQNRAKRVKE